eukprot:SAG25_NODE_3826_length_957_cov_0.776224_1_plen_37_part_10
MYIWRGVSHALHVYYAAHASAYEATPARQHNQQILHA